MNWPSLYDGDCVTAVEGRVAGLDVRIDLPSAAEGIAAGNRFDPEIRQHLDRGGIWKSARKTATLTLTPDSDAVLPDAPETCPADRDDLLPPRFDRDIVAAGTAGPAARSLRTRREPINPFLVQRGPTR